MKLNTLFNLGVTLFCTAHAFALTIPSDGSDGAFNPIANVEIDLGLATNNNPSVWSDNNSANAGNGVYDRDKWAVVFKYSSVNIPNGVRVTFKNHPTHAPVVWLVQGNATINGTVSVAGDSGTVDQINKLFPTKAGPGGFRGGPNGPLGLGGGHGPGGGLHQNLSGFYNTVYGNPQIIPLIGGSGGAADQLQTSTSGGGGGGAILVAVSGTLSIDGLVDASGGVGGFGSGSGGGVRLIAQQMTGFGEVRAVNPSTGSLIGRIRIETAAPSLGLHTAPNAIAVPPPAIPIIWQADNAPTVRVLSVDGVLAPTDPTAPLDNATDVPMQNNGTVQVLLKTTNFPINGVVQLRALKKYGDATWVTTAFVSGNFAESNWLVNYTFPPGFTTLQARATVP